MVAEFSSTVIRAIPHINSRIHAWNFFYGNLVTMLNNSGIGGENVQHNPIPYATTLEEDFDRVFQSFEDETETISCFQPVSSTGKNKDKKGKEDERNESMNDLLGTFYSNTDTRLGKIARRIGYEFDMSQKSKEVYVIVRAIRDLTLQQKLRAIRLLAKNVEDLDVFESLPVEDKGEYVKMLVGKW
ncbi:hypothetical protein BUALT_Bualt08G0035400 [Buddleja alternifolia]|uniref:Uncharacterized protein n=1 Tax=Buddleja alternifolia TaxID=168488 RepID=A0AAV6XAL4_9LAMI|nr:hypothetical protein BUALT_Bualt08G0035400 [Buddleja alternifolia]